MAANELEVNINALSNDITRLNEIASNLRNKSLRMFEELEALDAMWEGDAHDTFRMQVVNDKACMDELLRTVSSIIEYMNYAKQEYEMCEDAVNNEISSI